MSREHEHVGQRSGRTPEVLDRPARGPRRDGLARTALRGGGNRFFRPRARSRDQHDVEANGQFGSRFVHGRSRRRRPRSGELDSNRLERGPSRANSASAQRRAKTEEYAERLKALADTSDVGELVAIYSGLPLYTDPTRLTALAADGLRTAMRTVFEAVAHHNPFPAEPFQQSAWNHMVLKALFIDSP